MKTHLFFAGKKSNNRQGECEYRHECGYGYEYEYETGCPTLRAFLRRVGRDSRGFVRSSHGKATALTMIALLLFCVLAAGQQSTAPAVTAPAVSAPPVNAPYAGATISDFRGRVSIQLPGQSSLSEPSRGILLPPETTINTGEGRLLLRLSDGSDILVRPNTKLVLKQPETNAWRYLQLFIGRIHTQIQKHLGGTPPLQIGTPSAVISVRGTVFEVEVDRRGVTQVDVDEGIVELDSLGGRGEAVLITAGFSSRVGLSSGPEVPRPTHDLRPELDRPGHHRNDGTGGHDDDPIKRLEASDRDRHDHGDGHGHGEGPGSGTSGGGSTSGGGTSGGDGHDSGSDGHDSGSDGDHHSGGTKPPDAC